MCEQAGASGKQHWWRELMSHSCLRGTEWLALAGWHEPSSFTEQDCSALCPSGGVAMLVESSDCQMAVTFSALGVVLAPAVCRADAAWECVKSKPSACMRVSAVVVQTEERHSFPLSLSAQAPQGATPLIAVLFRLKGASPTCLAFGKREQAAPGWPLRPTSQHPASGAPATSRRRPPAGRTTAAACTIQSN